MNTKKIDNNIQYWHNNTELPKPNELILIDSNNPKYKDMYFIGRFIQEYSIDENTKNKCFNGNIIIIIGLENDTNIFGYNSWYHNVKKWMYLSDAREILQ